MIRQASDRATAGDEPAHRSSLVGVRDGEIVSYRNYCKPLASADALGSVDGASAAFMGDLP